MAWSSRSRPPDGSTKAGGHRRDRIGPRGATGKIRRAGYVSTTSPLDPSEVREEAWVVSRHDLTVGGYLFMSIRRRLFVGGKSFDGFLAVLGVGLVVAARGFG